MSNRLLRDVQKFLMASLLTTVGCTFYVHNQSLDQPNKLTLSSEPIPAKIGLRRVPEQEQSPCGDTFQKFVEFLRKEHVFTEVFYELRPTDNPDFVFDAQFNCEVDRHPIQNNVIGFFAGPLDLFTPLPLHSVDWIINASVIVYRSDQIVKRYDVVSHFDANISYWGSFQRSKAREAWGQADDYSYQLLVSKFREDRRFFEEHASNQNP